MTFTCAVQYTTNKQQMIRRSAQLCRLLSPSVRHASSSSRVLVVGTGTGGLAVASKLTRKLPAGSVTLLDNRLKHYNQPLWTLVGGGIKKLSDTWKDTETLIPKGAKWVREAAESFNPERNSVRTSSGQDIAYDYLVLSLGINLDFNRVEGLVSALENSKQPVCSNYSHKTVEKTWQCIQHFKSGNALFTFPNSAVKCAGAPQKIMYLFEDYLRRNNIRSEANISYHTGLGTIFSAPKYAARLMDIVKKRNIQPQFRQNLIKVDGEKRIATFEDLDNKTKHEVPFDFLHVTPPQSAPKLLKPFADESGFVDVDKSSMQSKKYANVFAIGDCSNVPTSKTAAAVSSQSPVVANNLLSLMNGKALKEKYDGYTSCPLVTSYKSVILAEFDYDLKPKETFVFDQGKERRSMFLMKRDLIPFIYWHMLITGHWNGPATYRRFLNPFNSG